MGARYGLFLVSTGGTLLWNNFVPILVNPILTFVGRRGRLDVVTAIRGGHNSVRSAARAAAVPHTVANRTVRELRAFGAVDVLRPGRNAKVTWLGNSPAAQFLETLQPPNLAGQTTVAFRAAMPDYDVVRWQMDNDRPDDPHTPIRLAVLVGGSEDAALDAIGPALDAVEEAMLPAPTVTTHVLPLPEGDIVADAIRRGM